MTRSSFSANPKIRPLVLTAVRARRRTGRSGAQTRAVILAFPGAPRPDAPAPLADPPVLEHPAFEPPDRRPLSAPTLLMAALFGMMLARLVWLALGL